MNNGAILELEQNLKHNLQYLKNVCGMNGADEYIYEWRKVLQTAYKIYGLMPLSKPYEEHFIKQIHFETFVLNMYFDVGAIENNLPPLRKSVVEKALPKALIANPRYDAEYQAPTNSSFCRRPILFAPFPCGERAYLLIDGNKRLGYALIHDKKHIRYRLLTFSETFPYVKGGFEQAYYAMLYEMGNLTSLLQMNINDSLSQSVLRQLENISVYGV